jgi:hypothetical protein
MTDICFDKIMTYEILFYDNAFKEDCQVFCNRRNITFLPSKKDSNVCYSLVSDEFREQQIEESQRLKATDGIFDDPVLKKFEKHHVLFVYEKSEIIGVVHFCDYNRDPVFLSVYPLLLEFERKLRELLISYGLKNEDMLKFFKEHSEENSYYLNKLESFESSRVQKEMKELEPFQAFDLKDLTALVNSRKILKIPETINNLRNTIMHAKDIVKHRDYEIANLIYDFASFEDFIKSIRQLKPKIDEITRNTQIMKDTEEVMRLKKAGLFFKVKD